jgi:large subunit ribosomal protein L32e
MAVKPLRHKKIIKKRTKKFTRWESEDFVTIGEKWRKPHGIDNRMRRKYRGVKPSARIGYGSDKETRHLRKSGFRTFLIQNATDLELLLTNNRRFAAEIAHNLSARTRAAIVRRAAELNVRLTNGKGKVKVEEKKADK